MVVGALCGDIGRSDRDESRSNRHHQVPLAAHRRNETPFIARRKGGNEIHVVV